VRAADADRSSKVDHGGPGRNQERPAGRHRGQQASAAAPSVSIGRASRRGAAACRRGRRRRTGTSSESSPAERVPVVEPLAESLRHSIIGCQSGAQAPRPMERQRGAERFSHGRAATGRSSVGDAGQGPGPRWVGFKHAHPLSRSLTLALASCRRRCWPGHAAPGFAFWKSQTNQPLRFDPRERAVCSSARTRSQEIFKSRTGCPAGSTPPRWPS